MIPLTVPEIRRLLERLIQRETTSVLFILAWSYWRRRHQAMAKFYHYQRRLRST